MIFDYVMRNYGYTDFARDLEKEFGPFEDVSDSKLEDIFMNSFNNVEIIKTQKEIAPERDKFNLNTKRPDNRCVQTSALVYDYLNRNSFRETATEFRQKFGPFQTEFQSTQGLKLEDIFAMNSIQFENNNYKENFEISSAMDIENEVQNETIDMCALRKTFHKSFFLCDVRVSH